MPTTEVILGDEQLNAEADTAYYTRQAGRILLWGEKIDRLKKLPPKDEIDAARIKLDLETAQAEIKRISTEVELAKSGKPNPRDGNRPFTPGTARTYLKSPSTTLNRNKVVGP